MKVIDESLGQGGNYISLARGFQKKLAGCDFQAEADASQHHQI